MAATPSTLTRLVSPSIEDGLPAPALQFGDPRVMALLACLCSFSTCSQARRTAPCVPGSRAHPRLATVGRRTAVFFTKTHVRIVNPSLAELDPQLPNEIANQSPIVRAWRAFEDALDTKIKPGRYRGLKR
jgi:hypothetical protein